MLRHLGYACLCTSLPDSAPRGTVLRNASPQRLRELIRTNLDRLSTVLRFNVDHGICLFRISSGIIPFGSHPMNQVAWWDEFADRLARIGESIRAHALRVSMHPGQHTVLSSPHPTILLAAVRDLSYHSRFLDALGLDSTHKVVVHVGGAYGDRPAALARWAAQVEQLPAGVRSRLIVENDERLFGPEDVLELAAMSGVPMVLDVFHHRVYSGGDRDLPTLLRRAFATWNPNRDGVPKTHYSSQAVGKRPGAHAEYVDTGEFRAFLELSPREVAFDCMLEAKAKELALFRVREALERAA